MAIDLDTFLTTVYVITSDLYEQEYARYKPLRRGRRPELSDGEVLTLAIVAQWQATRSERAFVRYVSKAWRSYFPRMLSQSQLNRRIRDMAGVLSALGPAIGRMVTEALGWAAYEVLDGVAVPLMRRCRGAHHRCFANEASMGYGGSDRDFFYGVRLLLSVNQHGAITGFVFGPAATQERWLAEALLRWRAAPKASPPRLEDLEEVLTQWRPSRGRRRGPTGPIAPATGAGQTTAPCYIADLGFEGIAWQVHWRLDYHAPVLTQNLFDDQPQEAQLDHQFHSLRHVIEQVNALLTECLGLVFPRARTYWGVYARLAAKIAACNLSLLINHLNDQPLFTHIQPFEA